MSVRGRRQILTLNSQPDWQLIRVQRASAWPEESLDALLAFQGFVARLTPNHPPRSVRKDGTTRGFSMGCLLPISVRGLHIELGLCSCALWHS